MEPEMNSQNFNEDYQTQNQPNPCEQPQTPSPSQCQWLQQTLLNIKVTTWLKGLIIIAVLSIAAALVAPKFSSAENQMQNSTNFSASYPEVEDGWYDCD